MQLYWADNRESFHSWVWFGCTRCWPRECASTFHWYWCETTREVSPDSCTADLVPDSSAGLQTCVDCQSPDLMRIHWVALLKTMQWMVVNLLCNSVCVGGGVDMIFALLVHSDFIKQWAWCRPVKLINPQLTFYLLFFYFKFSLQTCKSFHYVSHSSKFGWIQTSDCFITASETELSLHLKCAGCAVACACHKT